MTAANMNWLSARWETECTAYKDCDSSLGVWNDPPQLAASAMLAEAVAVGRGCVHLLADAAIADLRPRFEGWRGKRVACLLDETLRDAHGELAFNVSGLLPRYLFEAGIPCLRLYPSEASGFVDENRLFYWPVATDGLDVIIWIATTPVSPRMKSLACRFPLRSFLAKGGEMFLGGEAHRYVPYLLDDAAIECAWLGVQNLQAYGDLHMRGRLSSGFARLELRDEGGQPLVPAAWEVEHLPHGYVIRSTYAGDLTLEARVCFAGTDQVILEWVLRNAAPADRALALHLSGEFALQGREAVALALGGGGLSVDVSKRLAFPARLRLAPLGDERPAWMLTDQAYRAEFAPRAVPAGATAAGALAMVLEVGERGKSDAALPGGDGFWGGAAARWQRRFDAVCRPLAAGSVEDTMARRALVTTLHNTWRPPPALAGNKFGSRRIIEVQRLHYPLWAPYEAGFYAIGVRNFDPALARDQVAVFVSLQHADGWIPLVVGNRYEMDLEGISQAPTLAFAAWQVYAQEPDRAFLGDVYPGLCRNVEWWYRHRQPRGDGVFGFKHAQEGAGDDHPRADLPSGELRRGMRRFLSPDACGFVLMELRCLARMAEALGRGEDAARWTARADELARRTIETCFCAADGMFWDVSLETGAFERCLSPWHFVPLWAGAPLDREQARAMLQRHLIGQLLSGPVPLPVVDPAHPAYLSDAYWRGPSWPQVWTIALQTLWWHGFEREADATADRLVRLCADSPYIMEIYDSRSGQGISLPEYSFAATALIDIILRRYRDAPPWRG